MSELADFYHRVHPDTDWKAYGRPSLPGAPWAPVGPVVAGAPPVGSSSRPVPTTGTVRYVSTTGTDSTSSGSLATPYRTLQYAINQAPSNTRIVMRGGVYRESTTAPSAKVLGIQPYPGEAVWLDGSRVATSWTSSGSTWTTPYALKLARFTLKEEFKGPNPLRNHTDQVWIDDVPLVQVADGTTPVSGQFSVDQAAGTLTIGSSPVGKVVAVSQHATALVASGTCSLYDIGVRRYSPDAVEGQNAMVFYGGSSNGSVVENVVFQESAMAALAVTKADIRVSSCTIQDCDYSGIMATQADRFLLERTIIRRVNRTASWYHAPATGGLKITRSDSAVARYNWLEDIPECGGLWFDVSNIRSRIYGNYVDGRPVGGRPRAASTVFVEISDGGKLDGVQHYNYVVGNVCRGGRWAANVGSGHTQWWNNYFYEHDTVGLNFHQDRERNAGEPGNRTVDVAPWWNTNCSVINNRFGYNSSGGGLQMIAYDDVTAERILGWQTFDLVAGNWFMPTPPGSMVQLGRADGVRNSYNSPAALATSPVAVGGPPGQKLGTNYQGTAAPAASAVGVAIPAHIAPLLGVPPGSYMVGHNPAIIPTLAD